MGLPERAELLKDEIYITAYLSAPAEVRVQVGSLEGKFQVRCRSLPYSSLPPSETHPRIRSFVTANAILFCLNFVSLLRLVRYICTYISRGIGVQNDEKT